MIFFESRAQRLTGYPPYIKRITGSGFWFESLLALFGINYWYVTKNQTPKWRLSNLYPADIQSGFRPSLNINQNNTTITIL